jgi:hypothetical protein
MAISLWHLFQTPFLVTMRVSLVVPDPPAVKLIDSALLSEVIAPLVMDQA